MSGLRIWYYSPQRIAVERWWVDKLGQNPVHLCPVSDMTAYRIQGREDEIFLHIPNHPEPVPQRLWELVAARGFTLWTIDDSNNRRRWYEMHK